MPGGLSITTTSRTVADTSASYKFALAAAEMAANTRAENVVLLDLRDRSPVTEFFILATGTSPRQMRTAAEEIQDLGKRMGFKAWHTTGLESAKWILVDCVNVVAHLFDSDSRDFYDLELLWGDCPRIDWRKELGLPPVVEGERIRTRMNFSDSAGLEDIDAEEEEARLEGDDDDEEGDADTDEDADLDAPIVMEFPDESTGSNSVEFVEIDPPSKRRKRGRSVYPTPIGDEDVTEEERGMNRVVDLGGRSQSTDEDDEERAAESKAADDVEAVSSEDLPRKRIRTRPMGGVSAGLSSTTIGDAGEEDQTGDLDASDAEQDHKDEIPEAYEAAAETTTFAKRTSQQRGVNVSLEMESELPRGGKKLRSRKDERGPKAGSAAPGRVNPKRAKAGITKAKPKAPAKKVAAKKAAPKKAAAKKAPAKKAVRKAVVKKPAPKKKTPAKKTARRK